MLHENLQYALDNYNSVRKIREANQSEIDRLRNILPFPLVDFIEQKGYFSFHDGLVTLCNPDEMRPILALIFKSDNDFHHNDCHVIGYTAFGELYIWSKSLLRLRLSLPESMVYCTKLTNENWHDPISMDQFASGILPERENADFVDFESAPMFDRCRAAYGQLEPDECYGFFPALALAGISSKKRCVESIRRVKAMEHFAILAQLDTFHLMKPVPGGVAPIRPIG